jgi:predicted permease
MKWWQPKWRRKQSEGRLEKELRFHLEQHVDDLISRGHSPDDARRQAMLALGGYEQVKEGCRDVRRTRWLEDMVRDFRYALRMLQQNPGFAAIALLTLALGTGATTVMFTVVNSVLLRPLPYPEPERLITVQEQTQRATQYGNLWAFAYPNFLDCKRESRTLDMAAWRPVGGTLTGNGDSEYISGVEVSSELFSILDVSFSQGRAFRPAEDLPGGQAVMIITDSLWRRRYGASPAAIGSAAVFEGRPHTIIGVTSPGFRFNGAQFELFTLLDQAPDPRMQNRQAHPGIRVWARLRPGAAIAEAQTELAVIGRRLAAEYPASNAERTFLVQPLVANVGDVGSTLWLLLGAVVLVLLIACANVASLLLARAVSRERELAMRITLGAKRSRLVRQCLTESGVLAILGGALGVALAAFGVQPFVTFWPGNLPRAEEIHLDWRVLLFALAASLSSGVIFGLAPVMRTSAQALQRTLRAGARTVAQSSRRMHSAFVVSEIALAVVLLVAAGVLGRTLLRISSLDPGLNIRDVLVARMALSPGIRTNPAQLRASWQNVLDRARLVPGVEAVALVDTVPMRAGNNELGYWSTPEEPPLNRMPLALATSTSPDYLKVMGIPLRRGRYFDDHDRIGSEPVVVVDEVLAEHAFGGSDPVGKRLWIKAEPWTTVGPAKVVGVVGHVRHWGLAADDQSEVRAQIYYPFAQVPDSLLSFFSTLMSVGVRTNMPPSDAVESLRREALGTTSDQVLYQVRTMEQLAGDTIARQRFLLLLFTMFASMAVLLACGGIYGVLAYLTDQRIPEIGVRMALGANAGQVIRLILRQSLGMVLAGVTLGAFAAVAAGRLLERLVAGVQASEPLTFAAMLPLMVGAALFASFLPARRASRTDPVRALRQE